MHARWPAWLRAFSGALVGLAYLSQSVVPASGSGGSGGGGSGGAPPSGGGLPAYPTNAIVASTAPVSLPGAGGVSDTGAATYSIPLQVPAGPLGMQPSLAISYGGGLSNGPLGVGFALSGESSIAPCRKTFASEGVADGVSFTLDDAYCLDGQKLVLVEDNGDDATYRTEIESFARIVAHRASSYAPQPTSFDVWHRDGRKSTYEPVYGTRRKGVDAHTAPEFGGSNPADPEDAQVAVAYPLRQVEDRSGNRIDYLYSTFADAEEDFELTYRLEEIRYSYSGLIAKRKIVFEYYEEPRPDPIIRHFAGVKIATRSLLKSIEAHAPNPVFTQKVWSYKLLYETGADTSRSRLTSVTQSDQFGEASWSRRFEWTDAIAAQIDHVSAGEAEFDDVSLSIDAESYKKMTAGAVLADDEFDHIWPEFWLDRSDVRLVVVDLDGDGIDDVLYRTHPTRLRDYVELTSHYPHWDWVKGDFYERGSIRVRRSHEGGILTQVTDVTDYLEPSDVIFEFPSPMYGPDLWQAHLGKSRFADLDGDGRLDLLLARTYIEHDYNWIREWSIDDAESIEQYFEGYWYDDFSNDIDNWGRWIYGYANVGAFDQASAGWAPPLAPDPLAKFTHLSMKGPVWRDSEENPYGLSFRLFDPPFQNILADLDGDGLVERTGAFYHRDTVDTLDPSVNWLDPDNYDFPYQTELSTHPPNEPQTFAATTGINHDARWSCGNGRAVVTDYEGDGRADILAGMEKYAGFGDQFMGVSLYARLHTEFDATQGSGGVLPKTSATSELWAGGCDGPPDLLFGDWNGDGLEDVLYPPGAYNKPGVPILDADGEVIGCDCFYKQDVPLVRWNLGNGYGQLEEFAVDDAAIGARLVSAQPHPYSRPAGWDLGTRTVDLNRDGRTDILAMRFVDDADAEAADVLAPKVLFAYLSTGTGFHAIQLADWPTAEISRAEGFTTFQVGDVTGDGATDVVRVDKGKIVTTELTWRTPPDLLARVKDDGASYALEEFDYDSAWWGGAKRPEFEACAYPTACPKRAFTVVRRHAVFGGTMPAAGARYRETLHSYAGPRVDLRGRGFLGFAEHRIWDRDLGAETIRSFNNAAREDPDPTQPGGEFYPYAAVEVGARSTTPHMALPTDLELSQGSSNFPGTTGDGATMMTRTVSTERDYQVTFALHQSAWSMTRLPSGWSRTEQDVQATAEDIYQAMPRYVSWAALPLDERVSAGATTYDDHGNATYSANVTVGGTITIVESEFDNRIGDGPDADNEPDWLLGLATRVEVRSSETAGEDPARIQRATYDAATGQLTSVQSNAKGQSSQPCVMIGAECELLSSTTTFSDFDEWGNPQLIETTAFDDPTVRNLTLTYDSDGVYAVQAEDALGHFITSLPHPALGVPLLQIDANGVTTTNTFDGFGRPLTSSRPGSATTTRSYDEVAIGDHVGLNITTSAADGASKLTTDELGRPVLLAQVGFGGTWLYRDVEYDHFGNTVRSSIPTTTLPAAASTYQDLDRVGRTLIITNPEGNKTVHTHTMFASGSVDPEGHETYTLHDVDGRVIESGHIVDGDKSGQVSFGYGAFGQVAEVHDAEGNVTERQHDPFGRLIELSDPDAGTSRYAFDGFSQLTEETRATGDLITRQYDALGRLRKTTGPDGIGIDELTYDVGVGAKHRLSSATSLDGVTSEMEYDSYGRPIRMLQTTPGGATHSVVQHYDGYGRTRRLFYPETPGLDRFTISYEYGAGGHLTSITDVSGCQISPDPAVPLPACPPNKLFKLWEVLGRNAFMALASAKYGNNQLETRTYGATSGLLEHLQVAGTDTYYSHDKDGNLTDRWEPGSGRTEEFQYDDLHRLSSWTLIPRDTGPTSPSVVTEYAYTKLGNLWNVKRGNVDVFAATFGAQGKPHALVEINGGAPHEYDDSGRQLSGDDRTVVWTHIDRPRSIDVGGDLRTYIYDAFGSRVVQATDDGTTTYLGKLYEHRESISSGNSHVFLVHGEPGVVAQVSYESTGKKTRYVVGDQLAGASVVMLGSSTVERPYFDPFGSRIDAEGEPIADADPKTTLGFTGHEEDDESLINMGGRIYDRSQYRFLSPDPIISNPLFGQSYNPYAYVLNNPLRYRDPSGFQAVDGNDDYLPPGWTTFNSYDPATNTTVEGSFDPAYCTAPCSMDPDEPPRGADGDGGGQRGPRGGRPAAGQEDGKSFEERETDATVRGFSRGLVGVGSVGDLTATVLTPEFVQDALLNIHTLGAWGLRNEQPAMEQATYTLANDDADHEQRAEAGGYIFGKYAGLLTAAVGLRGKSPGAAAEAGAGGGATLFHGTDIASARGLLAGAELNASAAAARSAGAPSGFYLATDSASASHFALTRSPGGVLQYQLSPSAVTQLRGAGARTGPIAPGPNGFPIFPGQELVVPPHAFGLFNGLRSSGQIIVLPF